MGAYDNDEGISTNLKISTNKHKGKGFINYVYLRNPFASNFDKILATDEKKLTYNRQYSQFQPQSQAKQTADTRYNT